MTSGDDRGNDPTTRGPDPNWWHGAPEPDQSGQGQAEPGTESYGPRDPNQGAPQQGAPLTPQGPVAGGPQGAAPQGGGQQGWAPAQQGWAPPAPPTPGPGGQFGQPIPPYQPGPQNQPGPQIGPGPYQSGPQGGPAPYQSGPQATPSYPAGPEATAQFPAGPQTGSAPYQSGPQTGATPYQSGPQTGTTPYQSGPHADTAQFQPGGQTWSGPYPSGPQGAPGYQSGQTYEPTQQFGYAQQPYGGQPGYGQPAQPYGQPPNGKRGKVWLFAGIGALVLAIVGAIATVVLVNRDSSDAASPGTTPSMVSALTTGNSAPSSTRPSTKPTTTGKPTTPAAVIPGYQVVVLSENGAAYDVPSDWQVDRTTAAIGTGVDSLPVAGVVQDGAGYCPDYVRTNMFLTQSDEMDPTKAVADVTTRMIKFGYTTSTGSKSGAAEAFKTSDGKLEGVFVETTGNAPAPSPGCASTYSIYAFAFPGDSGAFVLTIAADTGVDKAVTKEFAQKLMATLRPI